MPDKKGAGIPLPEKEEGVQKDIEEKEEVATIEEAKQLFNEAKGRLLDVNKWDKICGEGSAKFTLTDESGHEVQSIPEVGYYFKIDIPGPGTKEGDGFDWVRVEAIEEDRDIKEDYQYIIMRVRPSAKPDSDKKDVAHFFSGKSTSNFLVYRESKIVTAAVLGRNEVPNTKENTSLLDKIRNALVGIGAAAGFSNPQWKKLVKGLLGKKD
ncbi:MAG TPA: hypothetical protein VGO09_04505 [Flavisolibacter sp.]|jgi:hypothetical protein|nr:hypothetical protein [Flavisolibacter sp.]